MLQANPELLQVPLQTFAWTDGPLRQDNELGRTYYSGFTLHGVVYNVGDCVSLFPDAEIPMLLGRIVSAFVNCSADTTDPHCIEVS